MRRGWVVGGAIAAVAVLVGGGALAWQAGQPAGLGAKADDAAFLACLADADVDGGDLGALDAAQQRALLSDADALACVLDTTSDGELPSVLGVALTPVGEMEAEDATLQLRETVLVAAIEDAPAQATLQDLEQTAARVLDAAARNDGGWLESDETRLDRANAYTGAQLVVAWQIHVHQEGVPEGYDDYLTAQGLEDDRRARLLFIQRGFEDGTPVAAAIRAIEARIDAFVDDDR